MANLTKNIKTLPQKPGVYLFKNGRGEVLYVGKAKNLKNRIGSSLKKIAGVVDLNYIIVSSEVESLILENNLIKQYRPRFNVRLRDDKNYQFIKIDYDYEIPQIYPVRRIERGEGGKTKYFGPYTSASSVKNTLKLIRRIFHLCINKKVSSKPCFQYHLGRCPGVCIGKVSPEEYRKSLAEVEKFLGLRQTEIIKSLKQTMRWAAEKKLFEQAAMLRDKIKGLEAIWEKQKIVSVKKISQDLFSLTSHDDKAIVNLFMVRDGKLIHQEHFGVEKPKDTDPAIIMESFLKQYYADATNLPQEVIVKYELPDQAAIERWLGVKIIVPHRGKKRQLLKLGEENAQDYYEKSFAGFEHVLSSLQTLLALPGLPRRIEAYDISNIQGTNPVGSLVVFTNGQPDKSQYRKFKINIKETPDDVGMMKEMLARRFARLKNNAPLPPLSVRGVEGELWPRPDLLVVDGGRGQLNAGLQVLKKYHLNIPTVGLAKRLEEIYLPSKKQPFRLREDSPVLQLLERIRDEAHRFAISFYRHRHRKAEIRSSLDEITGIGPETKKKLLQKFGVPSAIRTASLEALAKEIGLARAKKIKEQL